MKKVSFRIAKSIKDAGYPQGDKNSGLTDVYALEDHDDNFVPYTRIGKLTTNYHCRTFRILSDIPFVVAPTYLEVWLWLWREKGIKIEIIDDYATYVKGFEDEIQLDGHNDPEEAIIAAIEYLVDNNLIK